MIVASDGSPSFTQLRRSRLVVFDLDGTLIDSRQDLAAAVNATLRHFGRPDLPLPTIASYVGDGALALIQRAFDASGLDWRNTQLLDQGHQQFLAFYRVHKLDHSYVYPGVLDALSTIRRRSPQTLMACLTNKPVGPARAICEALELAPFFFQIYGGNSFATKKPDPIGLNHLISEAAGKATIQVAPSQSTSKTAAVHSGNTVVVGDGHPDVFAARAAGAQVIGCDFGFSQVSLASAEPDALVTSPLDWVALLCDS